MNIAKSWKWIRKKTWNMNHSFDHNKSKQKKIKIFSGSFSLIKILLIYRQQLLILNYKLKCFLLSLLRDNTLKTFHIGWKLAKVLPFVHQLHTWSLFYENQRIQKLICKSLNQNEA